TPPGATCSVSRFQPATCSPSRCYLLGEQVAACNLIAKQAAAATCSVAPARRARPRTRRQVPTSVAGCSTHQASVRRHVYGH
ncbi:hypothetical protein PCASD_21216, partial [Puccinia coronata f. sp. avenae]